MSQFKSTALQDEGRDDAGTFEVNETEPRMETHDTNVTSLSEINIENTNNPEQESEEDNNENSSNDDIHPMDITRIDNDEDKLDMVSVLSGTIEGDNDVDDQLQGGEEGASAFFGKNLSKLFDTAEEIDRPGTASMVGSKPSSGYVNQMIHQFQNRNNATAASSCVDAKCASRPPLAPSRAGLKAPPETNSGTDAEYDKRLSVFLRIRPSVGAKGKKGDEGSHSTIEVISDSITAQGLPSTIRTYPPLNSNAAKVVRAGTHTSSDSALKKSLASKSLVASNDDGSCDSRVENAEVRGVKEYSYSGVFGPNATQKDVYDNIAARLVDGLFPKSSRDDYLGESALLFTLGVTNAGKTHTVLGAGLEKQKCASNKKSDMGETEPRKEWGIIPRSLHDLLSRIKSMNTANPSGPQLQLYMSYLEIYNEQIYDLLPEKSKENVPKHFNVGPPALKLRESRRGRIFVRGLARRPVNNVDQGLEYAEEAKNNRHTASNNINANSSRSHSICQFEIAHAPHCSNRKGVQSNTGMDSECETDDESICSRSSSGSKKTSKRKSTIIWIVDLAGSERSKRTGVMSHTRHQKEAALINASLMNLMRCLREMLNHQPKKRGVPSKGGVVPFRESKLTHMFMNHLTGPAASRTCMIVNVNPAADDYDETQHVLSYASTARNVKISAVDYNRKRRFLAKESKAAVHNAASASTKKNEMKISPVKKMAKIAKKMSPKRIVADSQPKKRKVAVEPRQQVKRHRSNTTASVSYGLKKAASKSTQATLANAKQSTTSELEYLREENFSLKVTIDDLHQQLAESEAEIRKEVVELMSEQLEDNKEWYEQRIAKLTNQIALLQSNNSEQNKQNKNEYIAELLERINECEEEMTRMREDHEAEKDELAVSQLRMANEFEAGIENMVQEHQEEMNAERKKYQSLEQEVGALRHQTEELRVSHSDLLARYNSLIEKQRSGAKREVDHNLSKEGEKENPTANLKPSSLKKLPRERCSGVASTSNVVDIVSPKGKRGGWFMKSPAKVGIANGTPPKSSGRSPLGNLNNNH
mmetsp:Transcript_18256/g.37417  ORF Transcript_18256/g.37417 Transcript_18256/m.37417 type:complete len:1044 (+) Transcript_18256:130-3261(+)